MKKYLLSFAALMLLTGCAPVSREPDNLALVRVLGVDGGGQAVLTAVCAKEAGNDALRGEAAADTFEQARRAVAWSGDGKELSLTGVSHLVVGPDVDLEALLFSVLEDSDLGASAAVWGAEPHAASLLKACDDPAADLELLTLRGQQAPTVAQALAALTTDGRVSLPCLTADSGRLEEKGAIQWVVQN